jgi:hypothetical protein
MLLCSLRPGVRFVGSRQRFARTHETFALGAGYPDQIRCPGGSTAGRPPLRLVEVRDRWRHCWRSADPQGKQYVGSVIWRTEPIKASGNQKPEIALRADIEIPDRKFKMTMSFRHNTDTSFPISHTAELTFILLPDFSGGGVGNVPGILMRSNEQARGTPLVALAVKGGTPLAGLAVKVTDGFFLVGLSNVDADRTRNLQLLKERSWFDVPLVYANQRRATIAIEKGAPGERAFKDALTAWGEDYPTASTDAQTRVQSFERTALSDARASVQTYYSLRPDCNQSGTITVRVLKQPSQGTLEIARDRGFTNYAADNIRAKCNAQEVELTRVWYKSNADFKGRDQAQLEARDARPRRRAKVHADLALATSPWPKWLSVPACRSIQ